MSACERAYRVPTMTLMNRWLLLGMLLAGSAFAAFVPPEEGGAPFRRDKLPVDVATMTGLSQQLVTLAAHAKGGEPDEVRTRAQLIGLALALDPSNRRARDLSETMQEGGEADAPEEDALKVARSRAWNLLGWLEQPEAGEDGQALAACLSDVLVRTDPRHPEAASRGKRERGGWDGWVAAADAFRTREKDPEPPPVDDGGKEDPEGARLVLRETGVKVPLWVASEGQDEPVLRIVPLKLNAWISEGEIDEDDGQLRNPKALRISTPDRARFDERRTMAEQLTAVLEARHGSLPDHLIFRFSIPEGLRFSSRNHDSATGAMLVAADALFSGVESPSIVLAALRDDGELAVPVGFWHTLRTLAEGEHGNLVISEAAMEFLPSLLTLDKAEFLFCNEVLLAGDAAGLLDLASGKPPERLMRARESFDAIRGARGTRSLGSFVGYDSTRQRLGQVVELVPEHASARMLALRGTSQWPRSLPRPVYAREVRACLEPMRMVFSQSWEGLKVRALLDAEQECRESLRELEKLHGSVGDRDELYAPAMSTVKLIGGVATDVRRSEGSEFFEVRRAVLPVLRSYVETVKLLTAAAGDEDDYEIPFEKRWE